MQHGKGVRLAGDPLAVHGRSLQESERSQACQIRQGMGAENWPWGVDLLAVHSIFLRPFRSRLIALDTVASRMADYS